MQINRKTSIYCNIDSKHSSIDKNKSNIKSKEELKLQRNKSKASYMKLKWWYTMLAGLTTQRQNIHLVFENQILLHKTIELQEQSDLFFGMWMTTLKELKDLKSKIGFEEKDQAPESHVTVPDTDTSVSQLDT